MIKFCRHSFVWLIVGKNFFLFFFYFYIYYNFFVFTASTSNNEPPERPIIRCPNDLDVELPPKKGTMRIKLSQPKTNVDFERYDFNNIIQHIESNVWYTWNILIEHSTAFISIFCILKSQKKGKEKKRKKCSSNSTLRFLLSFSSAKHSSRHCKKKKRRSVIF